MKKIVVFEIAISIDIGEHDGEKDIIYKAINKLRTYSNDTLRENVISVEKDE